MEIESPEKIISLLKLSPHPEGGYYRQVYKDDKDVRFSERKTRKLLTHIYYLLKDQQVP